MILLPGLARAQSGAGDGVSDGIGRGAAIGALAVLPLAVAQVTSCGTGCDGPSTSTLLLGWALFGAAAGSAAGLAADLDTPGALTVRVGAGMASTRPASSALAGETASPTLQVAVRVSRHIAVHAEFARVGARFPAAPGAIPSEVLNNVIDTVTRTRVAGWSHGVESRRVDFVFGQLLGIRPPAFGRVQLEFLGGIAVQGEQERAYYDAYRDVDAAGTERVPGKYYILDFEHPVTGLALGVDAELAVTRHVIVVPTLRYRGFSGSSATLAFGAGVHWRF
jgi:hypothetical protein